MKKRYKFFLICCFFAIFVVSIFCCFPKKINSQEPANSQPRLEGNQPDIQINNPLGDNTNLTIPEMFENTYNVGVKIGFIIVSISLTVAGIMYIISPLSVDLRSKAKDMVSGAISGWLILTFAYLIITEINPDLRVFWSEPKLEKVQLKIPPITETRTHGVHFYKQSGCSDSSAHISTTDINDFDEDFKKNIRSVSIVPHPGTSTYYISILYSNPDLWGMCQYVNPNSKCFSLQKPFASSASINRYAFEPEGDGIYFFRKSCFGDTNSKNMDEVIKYCKEKSGGYLKINGSQTKGIYMRKLDSLSFTGVPEEEKKCIKYDKDQKCIQRQNPSLAGENISSMIINGKFVVLFFYFSPTDNPSGPWTYCQEFPTKEDASMSGPRQIKWQYGRNPSGATGTWAIPNYVVIFPVQKNMK